ncbi:MAG: hypothetical protein FGM46_00925 [Ferruginibacter sp.]|nr:hypothetical protein [Ferruginibacter sp.]
MKTKGVAGIWELGATLFDDTTTLKRTEIDRQYANASQNKKSCKPTQKPTQIAAHFILPNAPKPTHHPTLGQVTT